MAEADATLTLEVATPRGMALRTEAKWVQLPSVLGELAVLPRHVPLLAALASGVLRYAEDGDLELAAVGPGYVEVGPAVVRVLTDEFDNARDIEPEEARQAVVEARERMRQFQGDTSSQAYSELETRVLWAEARVRVAEELLAR